MREENSKVPQAFPQEPLRDSDLPSQHTQLPSSLPLHSIPYHATIHRPASHRIPMRDRARFDGSPLLARITQISIPTMDEIARGLL